MFFSCQFQKNRVLLHCRCERKQLAEKDAFVPHSVTENLDQFFLLVIFVYVNNYFYICSIDCESEAVAMY